MHNVLKVEGSTSLVRDTNSGAILNIDKDEYNLYLARKRTLREQAAKIEQQNSEINSLRNEMSELKTLLKQLIEKQ